MSFPSLGTPSPLLKKFEVYQKRRKEAGILLTDAATLLDRLYLDDDNLRSLRVNVALLTSRPSVSNARRVEAAVEEARVLSAAIHAVKTEAVKEQQRRLAEAEAEAEPVQHAASPCHLPSPVPSVISALLPEPFTEYLPGVVYREQEKALKEAKRLEEEAAARKLKEEASADQAALKDAAIPLPPLPSRPLPEPLVLSEALLYHKHLLSLEVTPEAFQVLGGGLLSVAAQHHAAPSSPAPPVPSNPSLLGGSRKTSSSIKLVGPVTANAQAAAQRQHGNELRSAAWSGSRSGSREDRATRGDSTPGASSDTVHSPLTLVAPRLFLWSRFMQACYHHPLRSLLLGDLHLSPEELEHTLELVAHLAGVEECGTRAHRLDPLGRRLHHGTLQMLDLSNTIIPPHMARRLGEIMFDPHSSLVSVDLSESYIGDDGVRAMFESFPAAGMLDEEGSASNVLLQSSVFSLFKLRWLSLRWNQLSPAVEETLLRCFPSLVGLRPDDFSGKTNKEALEGVAMASTTTMKMSSGSGSGVPVNVHETSRELDTRSRYHWAGPKEFDSVDHNASSLSLSSHTEVEYDTTSSSKMPQGPQSSKPPRHPAKPPVPTEELQEDYPTVELSLEEGAAGATMMNSEDEYPHPPTHRSSTASSVYNPNRAAAVGTIPQIPHGSVAAMQQQRVEELAQNDTSAPPVDTAFRDALLQSNNLNNDSNSEDFGTSHMEEPTYGSSSRTQPLVGSEAGMLDPTTFMPSVSTPGGTEGSPPSQPPSHKPHERPSQPLQTSLNSSNVLPGNGKPTLLSSASPDRNPSSDPPSPPLAANSHAANNSHNEPQSTVTGDTNHSVLHDDNFHEDYKGFKGGYFLVNGIHRPSGVQLEEDDGLHSIVSSHLSSAHTGKNLHVNGPVHSLSASSSHHSAEDGTPNFEDTEEFLRHREQLFEDRLFIFLEGNALSHKAFRKWSRYRQLYQAWLQVRKPTSKNTDANPSPQPLPPFRQRARPTVLPPPKPFDYEAACKEAVEASGRTQSCFSLLQRMLQGLDHQVEVSQEAHWVAFRKKEQRRARRAARAASRNESLYPFRRMNPLYMLRTVGEMIEHPLLGGRPYYLHTTEEPNAKAKTNAKEESVAATENGATKASSPKN